MLTTRPFSASAPLTDPSGKVMAGVVVSFTIVDPSMQPIAVWDAVTGELVVGTISFTLDANGLFSGAIWPTQRGNVPCQYLCKGNYFGVAPFVFPVSDLATPLTWVDAMAGGVPLTQQQMAFYDGIIAAAQGYADTAQAQAAVSATQAGISTTQAGISTTQAGISTTQAGISTTQAGISTTQAGIATAQAVAAGTSAASLNAALLQFNSLYLGKKSADPSLDNNGAALMVGAEYFNTVSNVIRVYTATGWSNLDTVDVLNASLSATQAGASAAAAASSQAAAAAAAAAASISAAHAIVPSQSLKTDYTLVAGDMGSIIMFTGPVTVTFPVPDATFASALPVAISNINLSAVSLAGLPASLGISSLEFGKTALFLCDGFNWSQLGNDPVDGGRTLKGTTGTGTSIVLTSDRGSAAATNQLVPLASSSFIVFGKAIARLNGASTQNQITAAFDFMATGYIGSTPGSIVLFSQTVSNLTNTTGWGLTIGADTVNGAVSLTFSGVAGTNVTAICGMEMVQ